jgi:hypothetical protein
MDSGADSMGYAFRGITEQKATGLGAVAGGLSESFVWASIGAILIGEFVAIILIVPGIFAWTLAAWFVLRAIHLLERIDASFAGFLLLAVLVLASPQLLIRILGAIVILIRLVCSPFREERENWGPWRSKGVAGKKQIPRFARNDKRRIGMTKREN